MTIQPSRRSVVRGAAWAVPSTIVSTTLPIYAGSQECQYTTAQWGLRGAIQDNAITTLWTTNGATKLSSAFHNKARLSLDLGSEVEEPFSSSDWVGIEQHGDNREGQTISFNFADPLYCVTFYITDIDSDTASATPPYVEDYRDRVQLEIAGGSTASVSALSPEDVTTSGNRTASLTVESAHVADSHDYEFDYKTSTRGTVKITMPGPVEGFTLTYTNPGWRTGNLWNHQQIYVSCLQYATAGCSC